jgi:DNA-3-methyladenine glycosylase
MHPARPGQIATARRAPNRRLFGKLARGIGRLRRTELPSDTVELARYLVGKTVVHDSPYGRLAGRIVETEAYPVGDAAGHAFSGPSAANRSLFLPRGHAYIRFVYGSCWIFNVSSETRGVGAGVLIRAMVPLEGIEQMMRFRGVSQLRDIARGPGRLSQALSIDKRLDGVNLCDPMSPLWLGTAVEADGTIGISTRIGLSRETHRRLRFYERGNAFVSGPEYLRR